MYTISVSSLTGHTITLEFVEKYLFVSEFKKAVSAGYGGFLLTCDQRLIYKGKQLEDCRTLESYLDNHPIGEPILIHLVQRLRGGTSPMPPVEKTFLYEKNVRNICVGGRRWENRPAAEVPDSRQVQWYPQGLHRPPASKKLYAQLLKDIHNTPVSVEEAAHDLLIKDGYSREIDGWYYKEPVKSEKQILIEQLSDQLINLIKEENERLSESSSLQSSSLQSSLQSSLRPWTVCVKPIVKPIEKK